MKIINSDLLLAQQSYKGPWKFQLKYSTYNSATASQGASQYADVINFSFNDKTLKCKIEGIDLNAENTNIITKMQIIRGIVKNGNYIYEPSPTFYLVKTIKDVTENRTLATGAILPNWRKAGVAADVTAETFITNTLSFMNITAEYNAGFTEAWRNWQFERTGVTIDFQSVQSLISKLYKKYLVSSLPGRNGPYFVQPQQCYSGDNEIPADIINSSPTEILTYPPSNKYFVWRDESNVLHTAGSSTNPLHNLGFIPSSVSDATIADFNDISAGEAVYEQRPDLQIENGDTIAGEDEQGYPVFIEEIYNGSTPWIQKIHTILYPSLQSGNTSTQTKTVTDNENILIETSKFNGVLSTSDNSIQAAMDTLDDHDHSGLATTEGIQDIVGAMLTGNTETGITVTYQDSDGTIDFEVTATAETNANDIFRCNSPGGVSAFAGTIATLPGGATLTYNISSGQEGAMVPASTSQLAKMRLYNTTRGTNALISNCVTGTNTLTLTANVPSGWQVGDTITIASQTVSGGGISWVDLEITSVLTGKSSIVIDMLITSAIVGDFIINHPFDASYSDQKRWFIPEFTANTTASKIGLYKLISNIITIGWTGTPTNVYIRENGYLL